MKSAPADPEKVLIVKLSAIGDVIQTLPMLAALRRKFPAARIDWLVEEAAAGLLEGFPGIDRVLVSRRKSWLERIRRGKEAASAVREMARFVKDLRRTEYDWIIDNHGVLKSGILTGLGRGREKIGYRPARGIADEGSHLFTTRRLPSLPIERHAVERYLDLVGQLGVPTEGISPEYPVSFESRENMRRRLEEYGFDGRPLAVLHPRAKWDSKQWPPENFAFLADRLSGRGVRVLLTGEARDARENSGILARMRFPSGVLNLTGQTGLKSLAALFSLADLVVTPDTGPMHLAAAVKAPLIALFGPTAPWRTGPYGATARVLRKDLACSPCFRKTCPTGDCLRQIGVEEVFIEAEKIMGERRQEWP